MVTQNEGFTSVPLGWRCDKCRKIDRTYAPHEHVCTKHQACITLVREHPATVAASTTLEQMWKDIHLSAWKHPTKFGERAVKSAIEAYAYYADDYYDSFQCGLGTCVHFKEHARNMLRAINASISLGFKSRLDSGAIRRLLHQLAEASGIEGGI